MTEKRDPPIEPQKFLGGVTVVDIGDVRVARGLSRRARSLCHHTKLAYDQAERRIWCSDCETNVDGFEAFELIVRQYDIAKRALDKREAELDEAERFQIRSLAAKAIDEAWRSRTLVPACPHCRIGLLPEDFKNGIRMMVSRELALARRKSKPGEP